jgi:hypothetical protein
MDIKHHTRPEQLERYSFLWSEARLLIAAISLIIGGVPVVYRVFGYAYGFTSIVAGLLTLSWLISGAAAIYLAYCWNESGQKLFGKKEMADRIAFFISIISGINLGVVGLTRQNIGMNIFSSQVIFAITGVIYLVAAGYLWMRWNTSGKKLFS